MVSLCWKRDNNPSGMPESRDNAGAVMFQDRSSVTIGCDNENMRVVASAFIYGCIFNRWSPTPVLICMAIQLETTISQLNWMETLLLLVDTVGNAYLGWKELKLVIFWSLHLRSIRCHFFTFIK